MIHERLEELLDLSPAPPGSQELVPTTQPSKPRGAQRYPSEAMPWFHAIAREAGLHVELVAAYATSIASACMPKVRIVSPDGWRTRAATWTVALAASGEGKTPTYKRLMEQVVALMADETSQHNEARAEWKELQKRAEGPMPADKRALTEAIRRPEPASPTLFYDAGTIEGLRNACSLKQANDLVPAKSAVVDELAAYLKGIGQYKSGKNSDLTTVLSLWSGGFGSVVLVSGETAAINDAYVVIGGGLQTGDRLEALLGTYEDGMTARWLVHHLPPSAIRPARQDEHPAGDQWDERIVELYRAASTERLWRLDDDAAELWREARSRWAKEKYIAGECHLGLALAKANEQSLRLMAVFAELMALDEHLVTAEVARYAIEVTDYCLSYWKLRPDHESAIVSTGEQRLDNYFRKIERKLNESTSGVVTQRDIGQALKQLDVGDITRVIGRWCQKTGGVRVTVVKNTGGTPRTLLARKQSEIMAWLADNPEWRTQ